MLVEILVKHLSVARSQRSTANAAACVLQNKQTEISGQNIHTYIKTFSC